MTLPGRHRGVPLWVHLAALVLVPLLGVAFFVVVGATRSSARAGAAADAEAAVRAAGALATAASAVDQEVLPTLTIGALQSPETAAGLGAPPSFVASMLGTVQAEVAEARATTDAALVAAAQQPTAAAAARAAAAALAGLRTAIDVPSPDPVLLGEVYYGLGDVADALAGAERVAVAAASAADLPASTSAAIRDVDLAAGLVQTTSRQLPQFLGWTMSTLPDISIGDRWPQTRAAYASAVARMSDLTDPGLVEGWQALQDSDAARTMAATIDVAQTPEVLPLLTLTGLARASAARTTDAATLLDSAVGTAVDAAVLDRRAADRDRTRTVLGGLAIALAATVGAWWVARSATRSLAVVATQAEQISLGALVDVPVRGPREMRTVSAALSDAVGSLRRIQDQAAAVARGDLDDPTLSQTLPGRLGQAVHASVQQLVASLQHRDRLQSELVHQAAHDSLTDLPNRAQAQRLTDAALARARRSGSMVGVLFVDLDGFKAVNDRAGHAAGDAVLRVVSARLADGVRTGDTVCRLGGDEFVALIEPVADQTDLVALAERLVQAVAEDVVVTGPTGADVVLHVGASIGVAFCQDGELDGGALIAQADAASYLAKARGKGRVEVFDDALRSQMATRHATETALRTALDKDELRLVYQPVVDVPSGGLTGFEALVRWHRGDTVVPPMEFVPIAEQSDLICDLDRWVLGTACRQLAAWRAESPPEAGTPAPTMSVNLSGRHLADPRVVDRVLDALTTSGVPAELLVLEVTETVLIDAPVALAQLARLRALGVGIAIDDFGTGYTSIGQLGSMPVDTLKIDRSFVASDDPGQRSLVALMIQAAHTIGMTVVAEGVELPDHLSTLRAERCDRAQGYLMARPLAPEDAFACYRSGRSDATAARTSSTV